MQIAKQPATPRDSSALDRRERPDRRNPVLVASRFRRRFRAAGRSFDNRMCRCQCCRSIRRRLSNDVSSSCARLPIKLQIIVGQDSSPAAGVHAGLRRAGLDARPTTHWTGQEACPTGRRTSGRSVRALPSVSFAGGPRPGNSPRKAYIRFRCPMAARRTSHSPSPPSTRRWALRFRARWLTSPRSFRPRIRRHANQPARASTKSLSARAWLARRCVHKPARRTSPSVRGTTRRDRDRCAPGSRPPAAP